MPFCRPITRGHLSAQADNKLKYRYSYTTRTRTYIEEHDVSVREVGLKGGAVVQEIGAVGSDRAALVGGAVRRGRRLPPHKQPSIGHLQARVARQR